jgi:transposase
VIGPTTGTKVYLATGITDMRKWFDGLAALMQQHLKCDPFGGAVYAFWCNWGDLVKLLWRSSQPLFRRE